MQERVRITKKTNFYKDYKETNPALVLGLILISLGFYIIDWIYLRNKQFEELDKNAPDSRRGAFVMMILPFFWFFTTLVLKRIIFSDNTAIGIIEICGWFVIITLIMKYLYDFCISYGKITRTNGAIWFLFFLPLIPVTIGLLTNFKILLILLFLPLIVIPAMQAELNSTFNKMSIKKSYDIFYS